VTIRTSPPSSGPSFSLHRLEFLDHPELRTEREMMEVLRESLPIEAEALAVIFAL
jgi:hypothetical protein